MKTYHTTLVTALSCAALTSFAGAGVTEWVNYVNQTSVRMPVGPNNPSLSISDVQEKDYAWADLDNDGDIDLVCVRKEPFTSTGKMANVLFMNEGIAEGHGVNGVLVDRTAQYASASDVAGDQGFLTPTNDRDVAIADVDGDGWLDLITATTLTDNQDKHLSHPRVYMNLGESGGMWQGFRYEDARIPEMHPSAGPRFCSVAAGDLTGNGAPDLYFGDYDSGGSQLFDYNNRLLINDGNGFFTDQTNSRLTSEMALSAFGAASVIADINNDGKNDVVKQTSLAAPTHIAVTYNDASDHGNFDRYDTIYSLAPYFVSAGDLNNDGNLDLVIVDDGTDRYMLAGSLDGQGQRNWLERSFSSQDSAGFGGNSFIADLDNDGNNDVLITDVDVDIAGCDRRMHIYRNQGGADPALTEIGQVIPDSQLGGTHDVAVFDIDNDGWLDLVVGRCTGTQVWMNDPPIGVTFSYPDGVPAFLVPDVSTDIRLQLGAIGGGSPDPTSAKLFYSVDGSSFTEVAMNNEGGNLVSATLPPLTCTTSIRFYTQADLDGGGSLQTDPPGAPTTYYTAVAAEGTDISLRDTLEGDTSAWTVEIEGPTTAGFFEVADPVGSIWNGNLAAPDLDATAGQENVNAWITQNGVQGESAAFADLDGGPIHLISPAFDLQNSDATISFDRWFFCSDELSGFGDVTTVSVSNDGGSTWVNVPSMTTGGTGSAWQSSSFIISEFVEPTANMKVRFSAADQPNDSITEMGLDNFQVEEVVCGNPCPTDVDGSGSTDFNDLVAVLAGWGPCGTCPEDVDGSGAVDFNDIVALLAAWGDC